MPIESPLIRRKPRRWNHESRLLVGALVVAIPAILAFAFVLFGANGSLSGKSIAFGSVLLATFMLAANLRRRAIYPLRTMANLLEALREGDYSLRGSNSRRNDAIGEVIIEINTLSQTLREQRLAVEEKSALLAKVIAALDIAVLAFDAQGFLKLANPAAERLLGAPFVELNGRSAQALGLGDWLSLGEPKISERSFPGGSGRWEVRRASFREDGRPHDLLVITDLSRTLREEERLAWQRLLRVLGHELNNSLAPIRSMAATLAKLLSAEPLAEDWREDAGSALGVIGDRAEALARFMARYTAFARLPPPKPRRFAFAELARRVAHLEQRLPVAVEEGPDIEISADSDQIEQALINLLKNAVDASLACDGGVHLRWALEGDRLRIEIVDAGSGLPPSENLFVPFFTTKPGGSGIGLVLARQIAEAHGGSLTLENRADAEGCIACVRLPA
ncbi:sensor histidine kinase [Dokdonella immobilis]|uniref:histidine kinase n=1 Tax=Dokdonella immobilis TaxID=578942 RepID=A0A1I4ZNZ0_9GAMM|nr:ATP-binding protein [Dokdonella immobilis]SFN51897.1 Histidine kinase-, DNA gyrase B-, and HSP90-like ATPase [Dokdonella immobilis]